jgi:REP element-mobilizing transposase RayT
MSGVIKNRGHKPIIINGMADHVHILVGLNPDKSISDLVKEIKRSTTNFINEERWLSVKFSWQKGYGAFSYSHSQLPRIIGYIKNQEQHHKTKDFKTEFREMLDKYGIDYDPRWLE